MSLQSWTTDSATMAPCCKTDNYPKSWLLATRALLCEVTSKNREKGSLSSSVSTGDTRKPHHIVILRASGGISYFNFICLNTHCYFSKHASTTSSQAKLSQLQVPKFLRSLFNWVYLGTPLLTPQFWNCFKPALPLHGPLLFHHLLPCKTARAHPLS